MNNGYIFLKVPLGILARHINLTLQIILLLIIKLIPKNSDFLMKFLFSTT